MTPAQIIAVTKLNTTHLAPAIQETYITVEADTVVIDAVILKLKRALPTS